MYEVKAKNLKEKNVLLVVKYATNVIEAVQEAEKAGYTEVFASYLSSYREVIRDVAEENDEAPRKWYKVITIVNELNEGGKIKACKYNMLLQAKDFENAQKKAKEQLEQGYSMTVNAISETKVETVI